MLGRTQRSLVNIISRLKTAGLKATGPRIKILQVLAHAERRHWSAEALHKALLAQAEDVGLATVYRVLAQFEKVNLVLRHRFEEDQAVYELAEALHHDHLVCIACGKVEEFVDSVIENRQKIVAKQANYILTSHALNLYGVCAACQ